MTDSNLLRYIIRKNHDTVDHLADDMGLNRVTLSSKINNRAEFKQSEIIFIARRYRLTVETIACVFAGGEFMCG